MRTPTPRRALTLGVALLTAAGLIAGAATPSPDSQASTASRAPVKVVSRNVA